MRERQSLSDSKRSGRRLAAAWALAAATALGVLGAPSAARAQSIKTFSASDLLNGTTSTPAACARLPHAVWVSAEGEGICIRYYVDGDLKGKTAAVFFQGDVFGFEDGKAGGKIVPDPGYLTGAPEYLDAAVKVWSQRFGAPALFFGRMGMHGSSGWHGNRRTALEVAVTRQALDQIKAKEGLAGFHLTGQSGGALLVPAVLAARDDIGCAVMASGPLSFAAFAKAGGITLRTTGKRAHYDPMHDVAVIATRANARLFLLTDPEDAYVPASQQTAFSDALRAAGGHVTNIFTTARGDKHHALIEKSLFLTGACIAGQPDAAILKRYSGTGAMDFPE